MRTIPCIVEAVDDVPWTVPASCPWCGMHRYWRVSVVEPCPDSCGCMEVHHVETFVCVRCAPKPKRDRGAA